MQDRFRHFQDALDNGLRVVTVELPHLHTTTIVLYARVGSRFESPRDNGLSHFLEHMLFRGTERYPDAFRLNRAIEELGGTLYAETARDYSLYQLSLPPENLGAGLDLFGEIFRAPAFEGIEVERRIILEEILEDLDEDGREINIDDVTRQLLFPGHALGYPITGPYDNVERFSTTDVRRHFARGYGAANTLLAVAGACSRDGALAHAGRALGAMPVGAELPVSTPEVAQKAAHYLHVHKRGSQTDLQILLRAVPERAPDFPALQLLTRVLDDGMSTRLHHRVCDELGLAYDISASIEPFSDLGLYEIDGGCAHENVLPLLEASLGLLGELRDAPPSEAELDKAKRRYRWELESSLDNPDAMAGWWGGTALYFTPPSFEEKRARVEGVTGEQVMELARRFVRPDRMAVATVGVLTDDQRADVERAVADFR